MPELATKEYCTGCTACASICPTNCISMISDKDGFYLPSINSDICIGCNLCKKNCPINSPSKSIYNNTPPTAYAAYSKNNEFRLQSSSGGIFSELAKNVINKKGVVYGAAFDKNFKVVHVCVDNEAELSKLRGAKYAQSDLNNIFKDVKYRLDNNQYVLFSGTPCQIGGLIAFLQCDYNNLLCIDFVCLSVPSPMAWNEYVKYRAEEDFSGNFPKSINLRSKITGWSRYSYSNVFEYNNHIKYSAKSSESLYMKLFGAGFISRKSCENCKFKGYNRISDITLGDFWGIWDILPKMDDNKGTSIVLIQSEKGKMIFDAISNRLIIQKVSLEDASSQNNAMITAINNNPKREDALRLIRSGKIQDCQEFFINESNNKTHQNIKNKLKNSAKRIYNILLKK